ncbi:hypothetical protein [Ktedonobacter robiniae]|uniref:Yip1 domain-containing protein n=1 Tax=Ktedonobacter robiniae TaxID=2778365 RepID=A0ABQ3UWY8_9CHLR|nr:hypothetical protein [Ktedonobacter robiniae]GHO57366.1 hypothetical protein KSB_58410 [Ktedonobacter robiniae]
MHDTSTPSFYQRWACRLIGFYPASWRERYADEMLQILEDSPPSLKTIFDLSFNLFDAHTHQSLIQGRIPSMLQKLRTNELAVYASAIFFFLAWIVEQTRIIHTIIPSTTLFNFSSASPTLMQCLAYGFYILLVLILLGGLPLLLAACWQALKGKNYRFLLLCLLALVSPILATIVTIASTILFFRSGIAGFTSSWVELVVFAICMGLSVTFIISTIKRIEPIRLITHYALYVALILTLAMLIGVVTLLIAFLPTLVNFSTVPGDEISYPARHLLLLLVMIVTTGVAIKSLINAFQTRQGVRTTA